MTPELDRLLDDPTDDLGHHRLEELRHRRRSLQAWESAVSLTRRVAQGRLDILGYELAARSGAEPGENRRLLFDLPDILAEAPGGGGGGRAVAVGEPGLEADALTGVLDAEVPPSLLYALDDVPADQLTGLFDRVRAFEQRLSATRRALHERIDLLQGEIGRRYRDGEATVESLLG